MGNFASKNWMPSCETRTFLRCSIKWFERSESRGISWETRE